MEIREWWAADSGERYWLEITDREDLGADLHSPQTDHSGAPTWSYSLMTQVRPGDVVLHWWKQAGQEKAVVGFSRAVGNAEESTIRWVAHGTYARGTEGVTPRPSWRVPLAEYTDLASPVSLDDVRLAEPALRSIVSDLGAVHGRPLYFPFAISDRRPLRTAQAYLAKLPKAVVHLFPQFAEVSRLPAIRTAGMEHAENSTLRLPGTGYQSDPAVRRAIERHAMEWALGHLEGLGYLVDDVGSTNPFDILALDEEHELHVEVKGSSGSSTTVELTSGEVEEATAFRHSLLIVVDRIVWERRSDATIQTTGGRPRLWWNWQPGNERLVPTKFRYLLPATSHRAGRP